jgi:hypothetical protein
MNEHHENRIKQLLQQAMPPVEGDPEPSRDPWPAVLRRIDAQPAKPAGVSWSLFDSALLAGLVALVALFPASIPVFLYYL